MQHQRARIVAPAGAQRAGHRRRNAAAHAAGRHHRHHHHQREDQREARQRLGAEPAEDEGLGDRDEGLDHHHGRGRAGELQQAGPDGGGQEGMSDGGGGQDGLRDLSAYAPYQGAPACHLTKAPGLH